MTNRVPDFNETPLRPGDQVQWTEIRPGVFVQTVAAITIDNSLTSMIAEMDTITNARVTTPVIHHEVHEGEMFIASVVNATLGNNAVLSINLRTGITRYVHLTWSAACGGDARFRLIENHNITVAGTALAERRMKRPSARTTAVVATNTPTTNGGLVLLDTLLPGGTGGNASGGLIRQDTEFILERDQDYLLQLTNLAGQNQVASVIAQWYSESRN